MDEIFNIIIEAAKGDEDVLVVARKMFNELPKIKGYSNGIIAAGIIYLSYLKINKPKSLSEVRDMFEGLFTSYEIGKENLLGKVVKRLKKELKMKYCSTPTIMGTECVRLNKPLDFIERMVLSEQIKSRALEILAKADKIEKFQQKNPRSVCGSAIYLAGIEEKTPFTQITICKALDLTEVTLRQVAFELAKELNIKWDVKGNKR